MKTRIAIAIITIVSTAMAVHYPQRRATTVNWRCDFCHSAYKRTTYYVNYGNGWHIDRHSPCPKCGR